MTIRVIPYHEIVKDFSACAFSVYGTKIQNTYDQSLEWEYKPSEVTHKVYQ